MSQDILRWESICYRAAEMQREASVVDDTPHVYCSKEQAAKNRVLAGRDWSAFHIASCT